MKHELTTRVVAEKKSLKTSQKDNVIAFPCCCEGVRLSSIRSNLYSTNGKSQLC